MVSVFGFAASSVHAEAPPNRGYVLQVQMTPAVCALDGTRKKQRKCLEGYSLTVDGLVPEMIRTGCETNTSATLAPLQAKVVARIIPDEIARIQLWRSVGGCMPMNATQYFRTITNYAQELKIPVVLTDPNSHSVAKAGLIKQFVQLNSRLPADGIVLFCQNSKDITLLTHLNVCYKSDGQYKSCSSKIVSTCPSHFTIRGIY
nr:ribonuclease I [Acinetobacter sp. MD2(2019)]